MKGKNTDDRRAEQERRDDLKSRFDRRREILTEFLNDPKCKLTELLDETINRLEDRLKNSHQRLTKILQKQVKDGVSKNKETDNDNNDDGTNDETNRDATG